MFVVEKFTKKITLTRGDNAELAVSLSDEAGNLYELQPGDTLTFSMKKDITDDELALEKEITSGNVFVFVPSDTANLPFGKYLYDIQLNTVGGEVYTVVPPSNFVVGEEITAK